ncbi:MAG: MerR family transcriptional regulator, partial [Chloroflexi bacterium]|nr:MerR family transcriptional regulator [Chloroflexota bacterium]
MTRINETPSFNLGVVTQETGIHPDTLRAWERRYGLPNPARTEGRHRLYSQRDIDTLRWLLARQDEGMSISKAVKLWQTLMEQGSDPLEDTTKATSLPPKLAGVELPTEAQIDDLRSAWVAACLNFDESRAEQVVAYAFALFPAEVVCFDIFFAGLSEIGQAWYRGEATVQQEHFASGLVQRRIDALLSAAPPQLHPETVVVSCTPNEEHVLPALMMSLLLRNRGWGVVYLGANVPIANLGEMIASVQPALTVLTAHRLVAASELLDVAQTLDKYKIPMAYGGWVFGANPDLREVIPGHYLGDDLRNVAYEVEKKILRPVLLAPKKTPQSESDIVKYYSVIRMAVESRLR